HRGGPTGRWRPRVARCPSSRLPRAPRAARRERPTGSLPHATSRVSALLGPPSRATIVNLSGSASKACRGGRKTLEPTATCRYDLTHAKVAELADAQDSGTDPAPPLSGEVAENRRSPRALRRSDRLNRSFLGTSGHVAACRHSGGRAPIRMTGSGAVGTGRALWRPLGFHQSRRRASRFIHAGSKAALTTLRVSAFASSRIPAARRARPFAAAQAP